MKKIAIFAFREDEICFVHVLLNTLDYHQKGYETCFVFEGASVKLIEKLALDTHPLHPLYIQCKEQGLIGGVCYACAQKLGALDAAENENLKILKDMKGHAGMAPFRDKGFEIITF